MFQWLNGPGSVFRHPLPGSTNYLNAYDQAGNLIRAKGMQAPRDKEDNSKNQDEVAKDAEDAARGGKPQAEKLQAERKAARSRDVGLPKEDAADLMPFPMNSQFRSQPVLSEELKDEIYRRVMEEKESVRDVSAALGVEMRRVGAVVRLKAVEKQWEQEVCHTSF